VDIGQVLFRLFMDLDRVKVHKHAKKDSSILPALLVANHSTGFD